MALTGSRTSSVRCQIDELSPLVLRPVRLHPHPVAAKLPRMIAGVDLVLDNDDTLLAWVLNQHVKNANASNIEFSENHPMPLFH